MDATHLAVGPRVSVVSLFVCVCALAAAGVTGMTVPCLRGWPPGGSGCGPVRQRRSKAEPSGEEETGAAPQAQHPQER